MPQGQRTKKSKRPDNRPARVRYTRENHRARNKERRVRKNTHGAVSWEDMAQACREANQVDRSTKVRVLAKVGIQDSHIIHQVSLSKLSSFDNDRLRTFVRRWNTSDRRI